MSEFDTVQLVALFGWLILAGSALAAYRMDWKKGLLQALVWAAIFALAFLVFSLVR